jgi:hypothetical protein
VQRKVFSRAWRFVVAIATIVRKTTGIANRSEAAKHCALLNCRFRVELESTSINDDFPKNGMLSAFPVNILYAFRVIFDPWINPG